MLGHTRAVLRTQHSVSTAYPRLHLTARFRGNTRCRVARFRDRFPHVAGFSTHLAQHACHNAEATGLQRHVGGAIFVAINLSLLVLFLLVLPLLLILQE